MYYFQCKPFPFFTISSTNFLALSSKPITISPHPTSPAGSQTKVNSHLTSQRYALCSIPLTSPHQQSFKSNAPPYIKPSPSQAHSSQANVQSRTEPYLMVLAGGCRAPSKRGCHALDSNLGCCQGAAGSLLPAAGLSSTHSKCLCNCSLAYNR